MGPGMYYLKASLSPSNLSGKRAIAQSGIDLRWKNWLTNNLMTERWMVSRLWSKAEESWEVTVRF